MGLRRCVALGGLCALAGCAVPQQMLAAPSDLDDYRAFRTAEHEGRRLYQAQRYLEKHPHGAWVDEVRAAFDAEEEAWFEAAKSSRARAREYLVDLPDGPHAEAARALLVLFDEHQTDTETLELLADARRTGATLDYETNRRKRVSDVVLEELAALLSPDTWGVRLDAPPPALARALRGEVAHTWGGAPHVQRQDQLFFVLPTPQGVQARVADVGFEIFLTAGRVREGAVAGDDLFVRWTEATVVRVLDAGKPADRGLAASTVKDLIGGALEATLPASRCSAKPRPDEILARECDGWTVSVHMGTGPGTGDFIDVHGPLEQDRAQPAGMR
jgi:hypothetical protein